MKPALATSLMLGLGAACARPAEPAAYELREVVTPAIARLEERVAQSLAEPAGEGLEPAHAAGLVTMLTGAGVRERALPLEEVETLGPAAAPALAPLARDEALPAAERASAIELLARAGGPLAAEVLLELATQAPEPWLRSHAAWQLGGAGRDEVIPALVLRLRYEKDPEVLVWVARGLARLGNLAGVPLLQRLREDPSLADPQRALASAELESLAAELRFGDGDALAMTRELADPDGRLSRKDPSPALRLAAWRRIEQLSGQHFQLRGVDDARHILSNLEPWVVELLCEALHERDVWLRVHAAQCLERMGPRAMAAGPALVAALADPPLAPQAARALGELYWPYSAPALKRALEPGHDHELRVAAARALGRLVAAGAVPRMRALIADPSEPLDLRQAAAEALLDMGAGDEAAPALLSYLEDPLADRAAAELALGRWLAARNDPLAQEVLERWEELGESTTYPAPTREEVETRMRGRAEWLEERMAELIG